VTGSGKPASLAAPLDAPEIDALFAGWQSYRTVALAVSGGVDSMALLTLAHDSSLRQDAPPALSVLTVDHGLRDEAADEAAWVAALAARLGLPHHTLRWTGAKPQSDLQAEARAARYDLMLAFCREAGIDALATAHTADDQAETMLMRLARGSGLDGVAAIPPVSERGGVKLLRPLLALERGSLEAFLRARGASWVDDPSNRDPRHERVRLRDAMRNARGLQLAPKKLALTARRLQRARVALEAATRAFTDVALEVHPAGFGEISLNSLLAQPEEIGLRALSHMAEGFGGGARPVRLARIEALYAALAGGSDGAATATLGGCIFTVRRGVLRAMREFGRIDPARAPLPASGAILWDGRFAISVPGEDGLAIGPLGPEGRAVLRSLGGRMALPARIAHALPALWRGQELVFTPFATFIEGPPAGWLVGANATFRGNERRK
jgi:tRNA(Ile)-lysidine synthase